MELTVSISSAVIAFVALLLAVWEFRQARDHARLSFKPYLDIYDDFMLLPMGPELGHRITEARIVIRNMGSGPARINAFDVLVDSVKMSGHRSKWLEAIDRLGISEDYLALHFGERGWIPPEADEEIFSAAVNKALLKGSPSPDMDAAERAKQMEELTKGLSSLTDSIRRLEIRIAYESVYKERDKNTWIGSERVKQWELERAAMNDELPDVLTASAD